MIPSPLYAPFWSEVIPGLSSPMKRNWLLRSGALTEALRNLGRLELQVVDEYPCEAALDEASALGGMRGERVWIREVLMRVDGQFVVAARSVARLAAVYGAWKGMRELGDRPLAEILYHDHSIARSDFALTCVQSPLALHAVLQRLNPDWVARPDLLARRSVFLRQGQSLLVSECFLPDFWGMVRWV
ncbi:hypothetical protein AXK11_03510 [Cephaloticoccus primus]|uniref:Chorismate lyase n=1 Tax=Cephaloticoccus primus TaxID=1548207 RepID=A0A139SQH9_9BACT|nr:chorismate lyase [Cephaloticoccus primus]KXU36865.1 hypothetical protein AXK11_03510 [Cephaloticoccus primus]